MTKIKICGLRRMQDIEYVNEALPDYVGFVFADSRRKINHITASQLKNALDNRIKAVGVFVNEKISTVSELCHSGIIDLVQLHGDENQDYINALNNEISNPIIKAIRIKNISSIDFAQQLHSDYVLLDTYSENNYGGTGKTFNWQLANYIKKPLFLAGGINKANAISAIESANPYCLDVSSGVETNGIKDREKIIEIVNLVHNNYLSPESLDIKPY